MAATFIRTVVRHHSSAVPVAAVLNPAVLNINVSALDTRADRLSDGRPLYPRLSDGRPLHPRLSDGRTLEHDPQAAPKDSVLPKSVPQLAYPSMNATSAAKGSAAVRAMISRVGAGSLEPAAQMQMPAPPFAPPSHNEPAELSAAAVRAMLARAGSEAAALPATHLPTAKATNARDCEGMAAVRAMISRVGGGDGPAARMATAPAPPTPASLSTQPELAAAAVRGMLARVGSQGVVAAQPVAMAVSPSACAGEGIVDAKLMVQATSAVRSMLCRQH